eukprot:gene23275-30505_t
MPYSLDIPDSPAAYIVESQRMGLHHANEALLGHYEPLQLHQDEHHGRTKAPKKAQVQPRQEVLQSLLLTAEELNRAQAEIEHRKELHFAQSSSGSCCQRLYGDILHDLEAGVMPDAVKHLMDADQVAVSDQKMRNIPHGIAPSYSTITGDHRILNPSNVPPVIAKMAPPRRWGFFESLELSTHATVEGGPLSSTTTGSPTHKPSWMQSTEAIKEIREAAFRQFLARRGLNEKPPLVPVVSYVWSACDEDSEACESNSKSESEGSMYFDAAEPDLESEPVVQTVHASRRGFTQMKSNKAKSSVHQLSRSTKYTPKPPKEAENAEADLCYFGTEDHETSINGHTTAEMSGTVKYSGVAPSNSLSRTGMSVTANNSGVAPSNGHVTAALPSKSNNSGFAPSNGLVTAALPSTSSNSGVAPSNILATTGLSVIANNSCDAHTNATAGLSVAANNSGDAHTNTTAGLSVTANNSGDAPINGLPTAGLLITAFTHAQHSMADEGNGAKPSLPSLECTKAWANQELLTLGCLADAEQGGAGAAVKSVTGLVLRQPPVDPSELEHLKAMGAPSLSTTPVRHVHKSHGALHRGRPVGSSPHLANAAISLSPISVSSSVNSEIGDREHRTHLLGAAPHSDTSLPQLPRAKVHSSVLPTTTTTTTTTTTGYVARTGRRSSLDSSGVTLPRFERLHAEGAIYSQGPTSPNVNCLPFTGLSSGDGSGAGAGGVASDAAVRKNRRHSTCVTSHEQVDSFLPPLKNTCSPSYSPTLPDMFPGRRRGSMEELRGGQREQDSWTRGTSPMGRGVGGGGGGDGGGGAKLYTPSQPSDTGGSGSMGLPQRRRSIEALGQSSEMDAGNYAFKAWSRVPLGAGGVKATGTSGPALKDRLSESETKLHGQQSPHGGSRGLQALAGWDGSAI